jgi:hypothetical protein
MKRISPIVPRRRKRLERPVISSHREARGERGT